MGEAIRVDGDGLRALAAQCDTAAAALTGAATASRAGPPFQATAAAVSQGHILIHSVAAALAVRATGTGTALRASSTAYTVTDNGSAHQIAAVGQSVEV